MDNLRFRTNKEDRINDPMNKKITKYASFSIFLMFYWGLSIALVHQNNIVTYLKKKREIRKTIAKYPGLVKELKNKDTKNLDKEFKEKSTEWMGKIVDDQYKYQDSVTTKLKDTLTVMQSKWKIKKNKKHSSILTKQEVVKENIDSLDMDLIFKIDSINTYADSLRRLAQ